MNPSPAAVGKEMLTTSLQWRWLLETPSMVIHSQAFALGMADGIQHESEKLLSVLQLQQSACSMVLGSPECFYQQTLQNGVTFRRVL